MPTRKGSEDLAQYIACPNCDALYTAALPEDGGRAVCARCHTVLITTRESAGGRVLALSVAVLILVVAAVFHPFLEIHASGLGNRVSLLDVATSFRSGTLVLVSVSMVMLIVLVPLIRTLLLIYVIAPIEFKRPPLRHAKGAFHLAQDLKPWAMTEVFTIGCAVALVKVADLATLDFGPAFWMFVALSLFVVINDRYLCTWSIWAAIEDQTP